MHGTAVNMAVEDMLGADVETAGVWDPFGYVKDGEETLMRRRAVEIKHGRVSMLAVVGYVMGDCYTFPGACAALCLTCDCPHRHNTEFEQLIALCPLVNRIPVREGGHQIFGCTCWHGGAH